MKKIITATVILLITASTTYALFPDVPETYIYYDAVNYVQSEGIVSGYDDGTYKPDNLINRAEFTKILIEAKFTDAEINGCEPIKKFPDVPDAEWYAKYVCVAKNNNIISGYGDGTFKPGNNINFAEAAKIVANTYELEIITEGATEEHWYMPFVDALYLQAAVPPTIEEYGAYITRGEMAAVIFGVETEQGYTPDDTSGDDDLIDDSTDSDDTDDDITDDDIADDTAGDDTSDDSAGIYTAEYMRELINDCSKIMLTQEEMPEGYTIDSYEVYRGGTPEDKFADCYQYIDYSGRTLDEYLIAIRYLVAESEEETHKQMEIIRNEMPNWAFEDQCMRYTGGKFSFYIETSLYFINGGPTSEDDEMMDILEQKAWDMTSFHPNEWNGSSCSAAVIDIDFDDQSDELCLYIAEDIALNEFEGEVFFDNQGVLRENECYLEVPEGYVKSMLQVYYGDDYMKAWNFFHDDYARKKLTLLIAKEYGNFYRYDRWQSIIEDSVFLEPS